MMEFFRKHQRIVFAIVVVIIVAFSFFGTYTTFTSTTRNDEVLFHAVDGSKVSYAQVEEMVSFLSSDRDDRPGNAMPSNSLNDGVVIHDFLASGLAEPLIMQYRDLLAEEWAARSKREQAYAPYVHPSARFVNAEAAWGYFAPALSENLSALQAAKDPLSPEAVKARINLFLAQREFPPTLLKQVLRYQEGQYNWLSPDPSLAKADLSLFGYHSMEDWFGRRFLQLVSEFIINAAAVAHERGLKVSAEETAADLTYNAEVSALKRLGGMPQDIGTTNDYLSEQVRLLGMTRESVLEVWHQILLFRRLFDGLANTVLLDTLSHDKFHAFADETVDTQVYQLPEAMRLADYRALQQFEVYLDAISGPRKGSDLLTLPREFLSVAAVAQATPDLVEKRYLLAISQVTTSELFRKVGVKATLEWQLKDSNWEQLQRKLPQLAISTAASREQRYAALEALDDVTRQQADTFARGQIIAANPQWLQEALASADARQQVVGIRYNGQQTALAGVVDGNGLMTLLDAAPLKDVPPSPEQAAAMKALSSYTGDGKTYYSISVIERSPNFEIVTFAGAREGKTLDLLLEKRLQTYYEGLKQSNPTAYQDHEGLPKPLAEVQREMTDLLFGKVVQQVYADYQHNVDHPEDVAAARRGDFCAAYRFFKYMRDAQHSLQEHPDNSPYVAAARARTGAATLTPLASLADQWKLEESDYISSRSRVGWIENAKLFSHIPGEWSPVYTAVSGNVYFFYVKGKELGKGSAATQVGAAQRSLGNQAKGHLMREILFAIGEKKAIVLPQRTSQGVGNTPSNG